MSVAMSPEQILRWYVDAGVDETIGLEPMDRYAQAKASMAQAAARQATPPPVAVSVPASTLSSRPQETRPPAVPQSGPSSAHLAMDCKTLKDLHEAMESYDGCALKRSCQRTVFADGNPDAAVMLVGEAPGADEDRQGFPFVGDSGKLLDRMLASIGLDRSGVYITNVVPWRPPGNRKPEPAEVELCLPFIQRHIELVDPQVLVLLGGASASALLARSEGITRLRGRWIDYSSSGLSHPIPALPTYHPAYLLRTPAHKREAWHDLLEIRKRLETVR